MRPRLILLRTKPIRREGRLGELERFVHRWREQGQQGATGRQFADEFERMNLPSGIDLNLNGS